MRFFLEFVSCCGSPTLRNPEPVLPAEEDERWLVPAPPAIASRPLLRKKRGRKSGHDWRPSLGSISEDIAVSPRERSDPSNDAAVVSAGRDVKRRSTRGGSGSSGAGAAKVRHRSYNDGYYGSAAIPTIMPTFSPTPFMF